jgi:6-phospho-3-hexuloisomerase
MISDYTKQILDEISYVVSKIDNDEIELFTEEIIKSNKIILHGAGRMGLAVKGFSMRLGHLGLNAFALGDSTIPSISSRDLLIVASGSGETQTVYDIAQLGKKNGAKLALITGRPESRIGQIADLIVFMKVPSKVSSVDGFKSIQPMTTLNEQCLQLLFDAIVLVLMEKMKQTHDDMWARHSNLE